MHFEAHLEHPTTHEDLKVEVEYSIEAVPTDDPFKFKAEININSAWHGTTDLLKGNFLGERDIEYLLDQCRDHQEELTGDYEP